MTEEKAKKRGWVKNAAIIFLMVMLVLTLFSNTIMNATIPEVAQQTVQNGTISAKIRGSGTVEANGSYEVKLKQSYTVSGVNVRVGDAVEVGDELFTLSGGESSELSSAKEELEQATLQYRIDLLNAENAGDYTKENKAIEKAQKKLDDAKAERDENKVTQADLDNAEKRIEEAQSDVDKAQKTVDKYQNELSSYSPSGGSSDFSALSALNAKKQELEAIKLAYKQELYDLELLARQEMTADGVEYSDARLKKYINALAIRETTDEKLRNAYSAVSAAEDAVRSLESQYQSSLDADTSGQYWSVKRKLDAAEEELKTETRELEKEKEYLTKLKEKQATYKAALENVDTLEESLSDLTFELEQKIKTDEKESAITELKLDAQRSDIAKKQKRIAELEKESAGASVTAPQAGIISTLNVKAGSETVANEPLAVIETPDLGYKLSFSVTNEQAKRVSVGDIAEVQNYWWGEPINAVLRKITADPANPRTNRLLVFEISGENIETGGTLSLSIGERSRNYDTVVPNSAVRTDNTGSFVLVVDAKSVPLGTRYTVRRADVNVLATDDMNTAVSGGGLSAWGSWVVTSSSKPIEPGMQVRLAEK